MYAAVVGRRKAELSRETSALEADTIRTVSDYGILTPRLLFSADGHKPQRESPMMLLTPNDVVDLTGYQRPSAQIRWLNAQQIPFLIGGDGRPKVLRAPLIERLGKPSRREPRLRL